MASGAGVFGGGGGMKNGVARRGGGNGVSEKRRQLISGESGIKRMKAAKAQYLTRKA
jgi:hypothetical protein